MTTERWHGTVGGYNNHKCRCEACRAAFAAYCRTYRKRPEVKAKIAAYRQRPETKAKQVDYHRAYYQRLRALAQLAIDAGLGAQLEPQS